MLPIIFHATVLAVNGLSIWYDQNYLEFPSANKALMDKMPMKGRLMFLTIWCLLLQTVYFTISLLNDLFGSNDVEPRKLPLIRKFKDLVFSIAFPVAIYVSISFWGIYNFDKELIFPEALAKVFPVWLNHTMHTTVSVFLLIELLLTNRSYPSRKVGIFFSLVLTLSYVTWIHIIHDRTGFWPYPIFHVLNFPMRIAFLSAGVVLSIMFYFIGEKLNGVLSSAPKKQKAEPKKKRK